METSVKDAFILLLKMGLWEVKSESFPNFPLDEEEWSFVFDVSISQTVEGIVHAGILLLPTEFLPSQDILFRWTARIDAIERHNKKMNETFSVLANGFYKNDIQFLLLKGIGLAHNYAKPLLRVSGDIDLYFPDKLLYHKANNLLIDKGFEVGNGDHNSKFYCFRGIEIEHHSKMIDIFNPFCQGYIKNLELKERSKSKEIKVNGIAVKLPSYLLSQIQANAHILKHYLGFGVGLRQFCDVARLCFKVEPDFDGDELKNAYTQLGIKNWMELMHNFLVNELGLPISKLPYPIKTKYDTGWLLEDIFASGNFGFHDVRYRKDNAKITEKYYKRDRAYKRIMPHLKKLIKFAPQEVIWYPISKVYTKLGGK